MKKLLLGSVGFVAMMAGPALSADLAPVYKAAPAPYVSSWTGFYAGIGVGGRWTDNDWTTTATFAPIGILIPPTTSPTASFNNGAFRVSGYAGHNWQVAPTWVAGVEADFGWANNHSTLASSIPGLGILNAGSFTEVKGKWDASVRFRAGYLVTPWMLAYATGGVAAQHVEAIATCPADTNVCNPANGTQSFTTSNDRVGWTVGGGLEAMFAQNLLARVEYRYADFDTFHFTAIPFSVSTFGANADLATKTHIVTFGLAYKFGWDPIVAMH